MRMRRMSDHFMALESAMWCASTLPSRDMYNINGCTVSWIIIMSWIET
jgi:hypothetical protein